MCACLGSHQVAGVEGRHVVFLLSDSHIVDEAMLADVDGLLNTGEISGDTHSSPCVHAGTTRTPCGL
jgi:hypothetical protein